MQNDKIDSLLPGISVLLFVVLYFMINPGLFGETVPGVGKILLGATFYSVLCSYLVLKFLGKCAAADIMGLQKGLRILLFIAMILFACVILEECFHSLPESIKNLREANTMSGWGEAADPYSEKSAVLTQKLSALCGKTLAVTVIASMTFHVLQLICHSQIRQINTVVSIPAFSILFVLMALLMSRYVRENQKLKQDNDLFI